MLGTGFVSIYLSIPYGLLLSTCIAYAYILVQMIRIMYRYFPKSYEANFEFLIWFDEYFNLFKVGIYLFIGLFAHIVINWFGPLSKGIGGLFRTAPVMMYQPCWLILLLSFYCKFCCLIRGCILSKIQEILSIIRWSRKCRQNQSDGSRYASDLRMN